MRVVAAWGPASAFKFDIDPQRDEMTIISLGAGRGVGMKDGHFFCTNLPPWVCNRLKQRIDRDPEGLQQEAARLSERFLSNVGAAMFVMLPLFALWQKIVYRGRRMRYTEHLVFALHLLAFWFAALMPMPAYTLVAMRHVYGERWWGPCCCAQLWSACSTC